MTRQGHDAGWVPLLVEGVAATSVMVGATSWALTAHLAAATLAGFLSLRWVKRPGHGNAALAAALVVAAVPVVGASIVTFVLWPSWMRRQSVALRGTVEIPLPDPLADADAIDWTPSVPGGPIRELLRDGVSQEERVRAVMALRHMDARHAVPLLRLAFSHESEDVRLLAFAILDRREKRLRARIKATESRLAARSATNPSGKSERAAWHRRLARDQWELVYGGFVSADVRGAALDAAARHANAALEHEMDARTAVLLARIRLAERRPAEAWACLEHAEQTGATHATCAPLFAEAAYMMRRFSQIPALLGRAHPEQLRRPELAPVAQFWTARGRDS
jgi:polysaccharide biosynthesis protein PelE